MKTSRFHELLELRTRSSLSPIQEKELFALLLDHPEHREEFDRWLDIEQALRSVNQIPVPPGLSGRIADRVLAAAPEQRVSFFLRSSVRIAAGFLLVAILALGTHLLTEENAYADRSDQHRQEATILKAWEPYGLTDEQETAILQLKRSFTLQSSGATPSGAENLEEELISAVLRVLNPDQRTRYGREHGLSEEEMGRRVQK